MTDLTAENSGYFQSAFDDSHVRPVLMEYEKWSRGTKPNWQWIRNEIRKSSAVFVLLTNNVADRMQTRIWVSFEVGIAAASSPQKPVYVFNEESVNFPVPFLNHYFPFRLTPTHHPPMYMVAYDIFKERNRNQKMLEEIVRRPRLAYKGKIVKCWNCKTVSATGPKISNLLVLAVIAW